MMSVHLNLEENPEDYSHCLPYSS